MMRFSKRLAFTLVELLVVIGVIAVLIGLLLPALNKAREAGQRTVCLSNLRSWGAVIHMYANDNKGILPGHYHQYLIGTFEADGANWHISESLVNTYKIPKKVWFCPTSPLYNPDDADVGVNSYWDPLPHWDSYGRVTTYVVLMGNKYDRRSFYRNGYADVIRMGKKTNPQAPIMADFCAWSVGLRWRIVNHNVGKPKGAHRLLLDGSATWRPITTDMLNNPLTSKDANFVHPIDGGTRYFW